MTTTKKSTTTITIGYSSIQNALAHYGADIEKCNFDTIKNSDGNLGQFLFIRTETAMARLAKNIKTQKNIAESDESTEADKTKALVSYLPERTYFNGWMKVCELLDYFEEFYSDFDSQKAYKLLAELNIDPKAKLKTLSKGTKEKVQLILVMSRKAKLYLLDEPIAGVDPAAREYILSTIVGNYAEDSTIVITTHLIADVEQVLDDYFFMTYGGKILESGSVEATRMEKGCSLDEYFREVFRCSQNF